MFAEQVGVDESTASLWLSGKRMPIATMVPKIAEVLGMEPNYMQGLFVALELRRTQTDTVCRYVVTHLDSLAKEDQLTND
jgi:transcriptional regulator with XRE-family HTH domain